MVKTNKNGDKLRSGDKVIVTTERSRFKGQVGTITYLGYTGYFSYSTPKADIKLKDGKVISLVIDSISNKIPDNSSPTTKDNDGLYVVVCKTHNKIVKKGVKEQHATFLANERINSGDSKEVLVYRAIKRFTKHVKEEKI